MRTLKISLIVFILPITISAQWEWEYLGFQGMYIYDIAIDDDELTLAKLAQIRADMEIVPTLLAIDMVWMNRATETLRKRILNEGKILYERQG